MLSVMGKNAVKKGEVIFAQGDKLTQVGVVLSGKILQQNEHIKLLRGQGSFIALNEIGKDVYDSTYTVEEDAVIYALSTETENPLHDIAMKGGDFRAIMVSSQYKAVTTLCKTRQNLANRVERIYQSLARAYEDYKKICTAMEIQVIALDELEELKPYEKLYDMYEDKIIYYEEAAKIPLAAHKQYFSYSEEMVCQQVMEVASIIMSYKEDCISMEEYIREQLNYLCIRSNHNLFEYACVQGQEMRRKGNVPGEMETLLESIVNESAFQYNELKKQSDNLPPIDISKMQQRTFNVVSKEMTESEKKTHEEKQEAIKRDVLSLKGSMEQIIKYGELGEEDAEKLRTNVEYLVKAPDRLSVEDDVKKAKKTITPIVFTLYLKCYNVLKEGLGAPPKAVELFLNFGMLDERLLDQEHLEFLCGVEFDKNEGPCTVFTMTEWLDLIKSGERMPSKSEFDEDYVENLRTLRKQGDITEAEQKALLDDMDKRVEYEVMNMQTANSRTVYGQPSAYMPILYKEAIFGYLDKLLVTKKKINECVEKFHSIDYSVFYREVLYSNNELKIINETVMKEVYPDIILFPLYGINAAMWQEVGGKNKGTPARFCFPIMCSTSLDDLMVKMFGRLRWELCRCIQGMSWNDVKVKSLTSEYSDYIQFYRKNRDLSDEGKEKVKLQIQKARNNSREIFLLDYEAWIKSEANGSVKMNKVAREILATYCPFEKSLRAKLSAQKPYEVAMARHMRECTKKKQEFELKIKALQKITEEVPQEMVDTYKFYTEF